MPKASLHAIHYTHTYKHTHISMHMLFQTITKLISKQIFKTLWTCPNGTVSCLSVCVSPIFTLLIHVLTCCKVSAKVICQAPVLSITAIGPPHTGSLSEPKFSWRTKTLTSSGSHVARLPPCAAPLWAPYLIPLCQSCCWQHSAGLKNSTSILCDAPNQKARERKRETLQSFILYYPSCICKVKTFLCCFPMRISSAAWEGLWVFFTTSE